MVSIAVCHKPTFDTSLNKRMPLGEEESNASRVFLFMTNSAMNLSSAVVTSGVSAQASKHRQITGKWAGYSQSNISPARHTLSPAGLCSEVLPDCQDTT